MPGRGNRYGGKWPAVRKAHLERHPWCVLCAQAGERVRATDVDHIVRAKPSEKAFWQPSNHRGLCPTHHRSKSGREAHGLKEKMGCGPDGLPNSPDHPWYRS